MNLLGVGLVLAGLAMDIAGGMWIAHYITKTNLAVRGVAPVVPAGDNTPTVEIQRVPAYNPGTATIPGRTPRRRPHAVDATRQMSAIDARGPRA